MNQNIENMIRRELERMGIAQDDEQREQETPEQQPQYVPIEAVLSAAIGDRPVVGQPLALNSSALERIAAGKNGNIKGGGTW